MKAFRLLLVACLAMVAAQAFALGEIEDRRAVDQRQSAVTVETERPPASLARLQERFPIYQESVLNKMRNASIQGVSFLAEYDGNPGEIYVRYDSTDFEGGQPFHEFQYVTVYAPNGNSVLFYDFSDVLPLTSREVIVKIPETDNDEAGIWRIDFLGGQHGDRVAVGLPETDTWAIGGHFKLGVTETTPDDMYVYLPESMDKFRVYAFAFSNEQGDTVNVSVYKPNGELYVDADGFQERSVPGTYRHMVTVACSGCAPPPTARAWRAPGR